MEIVLIILTGIITGAIIVASFYLGYTQGTKVKDKPNIEVNKDNASLLGELANLMSYTGEKE